MSEELVLTIILGVLLIVGSAWVAVSEREVRTLPMNAFFVCDSHNLALKDYTAEKGVLTRVECSEKEDRVVYTWGDKR